MISKRSRHSLDGEIIKLRRGLAIYKTHASPYYFARILDKRTKKYIIRSTKESSRIQARDVAEELATSLLSKQEIISNEHTFDYYTDRMLKRAEIGIAQGTKNPQYLRVVNGVIDNPNYGLRKFFTGVDVRKIRTKEYQEYVDFVFKIKKDLSPSSVHKITSVLRNILKVARDDGVIDDVPATPRVRQQDNPRPFFKFAPLVSPEHDAWEQLKKSALKLAEEKLVVRGKQITEELYDLILFVVHSFVRPVSSELYNLTHGDVTIADKPKRLILTIKKGKTGFRTSITMPAAVSVYERIKKRNPGYKSTDYLFFPNASSRGLAQKIIETQFRAVLDHVENELGPDAVKGHTLYSLRHTAICMRLVLSGGKVNIYNLAKTAGTSVEQIERFYARNLPMSAELARNLHTFE